MSKFKVQTFNKISDTGLSRFPAERYAISDEVSNPDALLVRSASLHDFSFERGLKAIARAGAGVNNIPLDKCTSSGIVVFNTPGANANAVKELVIAGLLLSSRKIIEGINWSQTLKGKGEEVTKLIEKGKSNFAGPEIYGKTLGVIGLGAIGMLAANAGESMGMRVIGYDPYISIDSAWQLSKYVQKAQSLDQLLAEADYITLHVPLIDATKGFINKKKFQIMKDGVSILNFARGGLVNKQDLMEALDGGRVHRFVTDFPSDNLLGHEKIIAVPHLGASTPESEDNCAVMAVDQILDYLENGNIKNSVNFPTADLPRNGGSRVLIANKNVPGLVGKITSSLAEQNINIADMLNKHRNDIAYNIIDVDGEISDNQFAKISEIEEIITVRVLQPLAS